MDVLRRTELPEYTVAHDGDAGAHRHRFDLVVGDVHDGGACPHMELDELGAHLDTEPGVEVRQRLVHEKHLRMAHDGPREGDALALATRELGGLAFEEPTELERLGGFSRNAWSWGDDVPRPSLEAGDDAEQRGLATPRRTEQDEKLPRVRHEINRRQGDGRPEFLLDCFELDARWVHLDA